MILAMMNSVQCADEDDVDLEKATGRSYHRTNEYERTRES